MHWWLSAAIRVSPITYGSLLALSSKCPTRSDWFGTMRLRDSAATMAASSNWKLNKRLGTISIRGWVSKRLTALSRKLQHKRADFCRSFQIRWLSNLWYMSAPILWMPFEAMPWQHHAFYAAQCVSKNTSINFVLQTNFYAYIWASIRCYSMSFQCSLAAVNVVYLSRLCRVWQRFLALIGQLALHAAWKLQQSINLLLQQMQIFCAQRDGMI